jgi:hypothetical protein
MMGVALIGAIAVGAGESRADVATGIDMTGGFIPTNPDPTFEYLFTAILQQYKTVYQNDYIKVYNANLTQSLVSYTCQPDDWHASFSSDTNGNFVEWTYKGDDPIHYDDLGPSHAIGGPGAFDVFTKNLTNPNTFPMAGTIFDYSFSLNGVSSSVQTFPLQNLSVPEPSSALIVLVVGGSAAGAGLVSRRRRRRSAVAV